MPFNKPFLSPDGRFVARMIFGEDAVTDNSSLERGQTYLAIKDNRRGSTDYLPALAPFYSIKWTGDSKTIVTIEHRAHCSPTFLRHFDKDCWTDLGEVTPPLEGDCYPDTLKQKLGFSRCVITYKVGKRALNGAWIGDAFCILEIDGKSGALLKVIARKTISDKESMRMHSLGE